MDAEARAAAQAKMLAAYDWDHLLDGQWHELWRGRDFGCTPRSALAIARRVAADRGGQAEAEFYGETGGKIRFIPGQPAKPKRKRKAASR